MIRVLVTGFSLAFFLACGPTPPDYGALARHNVEACGETFSAADLVSRAYEGGPAGRLPSDISTPPGTVAVSQLDRSSGELLRRYPCATDEKDARRILAELQFKQVSLVLEEDHVLIYDAIDIYGIHSAYSIFVCDFVSEVIGRRFGAISHQGLHGAFGENGGEAASEDVIRDLASLTFATNMTVLADDGWPRFVEGITLLGSEADVGPVWHPSLEEETVGIGVCVAWVEPNFWGGCDAVRVGMSSTVALDLEAGDFHQRAIQSLLEGFYGYAGWCGRRE